MNLNGSCDTIVSDVYYESTGSRQNFYCNETSASVLCNQVRYNISLVRYICPLKI